MADGSGLRAIHTTCIDYKSPPVKWLDRHGCSTGLLLLSGDTAKIKVVKKHIKYLVHFAIMINRDLVIYRRRD